MSDKDPQVPIVKEDIQTDIIKVEVDRSKIEIELQKELENKEAEKQKMQVQLADYKKELDLVKEKEGEENTKQEDLQADYDKLKGELQTIAQEKFIKVKAEKFEIFKNLGMDEDKLKELDEMIQSPNDLDEKEWTLSFITTQLKVAEEERKVAEEAKKGGEGDPPPPPADPTNPPKKSTVTLPPGDPAKPNVYPSAREAINDLYAKAAKGDKEAEKNLDMLWKKFGPTIRNRRTSFGIIQCQVCEAGVLQGEKCFYCGWDPALYKIRGGEVF